MCPHAGPSSDAERRLATEHATASALAESSTLIEAAPRILRAICDLLGWEHGALWTVDARTDRLQCVDVWHPPDVSFPEFETMSRQMTFLRGVGLPGRVWARGEPAWIQDVVNDTNFPRAPIAAREGLHAAFGFPILLHGKVIGIFEFFSREIRQPDEALLQMLTAIGSQIGLFVERRRAQEELDRFFVLSRDLFCIAGFDGFFKRLNPTWNRVLGYEMHELLGRPYMEFVHPEDREATLAEGRKVEEGADTITFENRYRCKNGCYRWLQWAATPYRGEQVIYAAARDVTERKIAEAQLDANRMQLQQNAESLAQLVKELEIARHRAEEATRAKGEFLANMSHEIRTPLTAIVGMTELALDTRLTTEQREYLETVKASSDALLAIVNDVLDFSKIEARRLELEHVEFGLRDTVEDAMQLMALRAEEKKLELACRIDPAAPEVLVGDPGRLRQVIVNLVGNAIKFTPHGEVLLAADVEACDDERARLRFLVSDTGVGVPAHKQRAIFEAFAQADTSTTRQFGGTGLGLTITSQLVQMMRGRLWVESEVGRGSTFYFTAEFDRPPGAARDRGIAEPVDVRGLRVLVVDDNGTNRRIVSEMLTSWHMRPELAESGRDGFNLLVKASKSNDPFRLAILDGQMPHMDGFQLASRIKHDRRISATPIVILTSMGRPGDAGRARPRGVSAYLTKPVKHSDLLDAIVTLCGTRRRAGAFAADVRRAPAPSKKRLSVLVAEDNAVNRKLVQSILRRRGHELVAVDNGRAAVHAVTAGTRPFDLVLMDVQMPEMGGLEATALIREHERATGSHVPIVAMTARAMSGDREECLRAGMDAYLSKPLHAEELVRVVERQAGAAASGRKASASTAHRAGGDGKTVDEAVALQHVNGDRQLLRELATLFLADYPITLAKLRRAVRNNDAAATRAAAHALKGSVAIFGAHEATASASTLQRMGESGELAGAAAALAQLEAALASLHGELAVLTGKPVSSRREKIRPNARSEPAARKRARGRRADRPGGSGQSASRTKK